MMRPPGMPPRPGGAASGEMEGYAGGYPPAGQPTQQQSNFSQMFPLPQQEFDPRILVTGAANPNAAPAAGNLATLVGWAHDWKTEPGKTYRYMIRYKIKNPVWATINVAKDKSMADIFAITSAESTWTDPIQAPPIVQFFFVSGGGGQGRPAQVEIFKYENGAIHKENFSVAPGDSIGAEKNGVDYSTGNTLVDLRPDLLKSDRMTAWYITPESMLAKRDVKSDAESPQRSDLEKQVQAAAPAAAAAAVGAGAAGATGALINPTR